ncbi:sirohydrochlorin cobaltochelatase [Clostridium polyendosporum]|uniref:Sirohydrochlorin cobaltochelatase n=1 Tax=Clostridium polyendosporum TaxID=69208 RepID=A0A919RYV1_9CLOT|nr:sirohydrochlorin cobaltochelatase [Clostridium polyendosporum]GIM27518.1 sirohydrochlorin cobaltochelatase [Clostridium polyendosporum]
MKKAILIVSNGTSDIEALRTSIDKIEEKVREEFKDYQLFRAFSSSRIISKLKEKYNIVVSTPEETLDYIEQQGFEELIVQPLYILCGIEYEMLKNTVESFKTKSNLKKIVLGKSALVFGDEKRTFNFIESIKEVIPTDKPLVFMAHGTRSLSGICYEDLSASFKAFGLNNIYIGAVEGTPSIYEIIKNLKKDKIKELILAPLLIVAGYHAKRDMASSIDTSWKSILQLEGFKVEVKLRGLGEIDDFHDFLINSIRESIKNK